MDRRSFVATTATVCAGAWRGAPARRRIERVGLQLYTVRQALERDFEGTLARVATTGYREVEFAGYFGRTPKDVRATLERHGLVSPSAHVGVETLAPDPWRAALESAHVIGQSYLVVAWLPVELRRTLDDYKRVGDRFNQAAATAHAAGIQFAYHNHDFEFAPVDGQLPYDVLLAATDPALVKLEIDLYWINKGGQDPTHYFERWPGRVPLVHVKDSAGPPEHRMTEVGAGTIDFRRIFAHPAARIEHYFVEHDQPADAFASIRASCDYLKRLDF